MRSKNVSRNIAAGLLRMFVKDGMKFIVQTVFIYRLSEEFLGASGLFTSVLGILNIAELGIGSAISFALYKPLAENDKDQLKALMALYKKAYLAIGCFILVIGLILLPLLPYIVKDSIEGLNINILYLLYLINTVCSYLFMSYKSSLLIADQKQYIVQLYYSKVSIISGISQILILLIMPAKSAATYYAYTITGIFFVVLQNILISRRTDKLYPYILEKSNIPIKPEVKRKIIQNVKALSIANISRKALDSIDAIIISASLVNGFAIIGKYSNYTLIVSLVNSLFTMASSAIVPSLGNFIEVEGREKSLKLYDTMNLIFTWMYGWCFVCLLVLLNPFIGGIWISEEWTLSNLLVFLISINFLINGMDFTAMKYIQAAGLYWQVRYRYIISAILNIILSILFGVVFKWELEGIVFATSIALIGMTIRDPYVVFKYMFERSSKENYFEYIIRIFVIVFTGLFTLLICNLIAAEYNLFNFVIRAFMCLIIPNALWIMMMHRTRLFRDTVDMLRLYTFKIIKNKS